MVFRNNSGRSGGRQTLSVGPVEHRQMNELLAFQGVELWCEHVRNALLRLLDQRPTPAKNCLRRSAQSAGTSPLLCARRSFCFHKHVSVLSQVPKAGFMSHFAEQFAVLQQAMKISGKDEEAVSVSP